MPPCEHRSNGKRDWRCPDFDQMPDETAQLSHLNVTDIGQLRRSPKLSYVYFPS